MKKLVASALFTILTVLTSFGQDSKIHFVDIELDSAYKLAKAEDKLVFVDCYTTWCGPCKFMDANIFTQPEVANFCNENFINVKLDMEAGEGEVFAGWYEVRSYPTYIFLDVSSRRRELVHRTVGSMDAEKFIQFGKDASDPEVRIGELRTRYAQGDRDTEFIRDYVVRLYDAGYSADAREISYWLYQDLNWNTIDATDADILLRFINGNAHPLYEGMMSNLPALEKVADQEMLYRTVMQPYMMAVWRGMRAEDPAVPFKQAMTDVEALNFSQKEKMKWEIELFYSEQQDQDRYLELAPQFAEKYNMDNSMALNSTAWAIYEMTDNKKVLTKALNLVNRSVELDANYNNLDTKMRILYAVGKKKDAIVVGKEISEMISNSEGLADKQESHDAVVAAMKAGKNIKELD